MIRQTGIFGDKMKNAGRRLFLVMVSLLVSACWGHSFPDSTSFIRPAAGSVSAAETVHVFVDPNGTFYPSGWNNRFRAPLSWKAHSLLNQSVNDPDFRQFIETDERKQLSELSDFAKEKERIFILVHGFNNTQNEALAAYTVIERAINATEADGFVRFYWDGLTARGVGAGKIWFNAAGYSQLAGARGLRRVLGTIKDKEIYLISHSRGASVVLSALGNPIYDPSFRARTEGVVANWGGTYREFMTPPELTANGNTLHFLALAPAVDRIDFCDVSTQLREPGSFECKTLRDLSALSSFRYTVNPEDPVLDKFAGLSGRFNPTGMGVDYVVGERLSQNYPMLKAYVFRPNNRFHSFGRYVESEVFVKMLGDAKLLGDRGD